MRALGLVLIVAACASTTPAQKVGSSSSETYADEVVNAAAVAATEPEVVLRYNPVRCTCPPFEVQLGARWVRVRVAGLDSKGSAASQLLVKAKADLDASRVVQYPVKGELGTTTSQCGQGALFLDFEPTP